MIAKWLLLGLALAASNGTYRQALPGYRFRFPRDHFDHPDFRTEWWYYTGNVRTDAGKRLGFELVFFRQAQRRGPPDNLSAWRIDDLYLAHLALTDIDAGRFQYRERLNRAGPGIAGVSFEKRRIWNGNWSAIWDGDRQTLEAVAGGIRFNLRLTPLKPPVINGENGVSQKAEGAGRASYYVSFSRLAVEGEISGRRVRGTAWMDHEWFTHELDPAQAGWDWFSVQLDDGADLMLYELRRKDGTIDPFSSGTYIDQQGRARHLTSRDFKLEPAQVPQRTASTEPRASASGTRASDGHDYWTSPKTHARYPIRWRIRVPSLGLTLECAAALADQELAGDAAGPTYWEGAVTYSGSATGVGYLEMTGYDKPMGAL